MRNDGVASLALAHRKQEGADRRTDASEVRTQPHARGRVAG